jgi:hypothetical protein
VAQIFYTTGMEHSPDERDRHRVGAHAVARDALAAWALRKAAASSPSGAPSSRPL